MKKFYQIKKYIIKIIYAVKDFNYYHAGSIIGSFPISAYPPEYSCAVTPQVRQTGNRLSGLAGTAYASLLA